MENARLMKYVLMFLIITVAGCGASDEEKVDNAILSAQVSLSNLRCDEAINTLEEVGRQNTNAEYLQTLASAYACKADFTTGTIFGTDLVKIGDPTIMGGFARFTNADSMTAVNEAGYLNLVTAIQILAFAGGISSTLDASVALRAERFTSDEADSINAQLLYMVLDMMGRYVRFYSGADSAGAQANCMLNYSDNNTDLVSPNATLDTYLGTTTAPCQSTADAGNNDLGDIDAGLTSDEVTRRCQGLTMMNIFLDLVENFIARLPGDEFDDLDAITGSLNTIRTTVQTRYNEQESSLFTLTSLSNCESIYAPANTTQHPDFDVFFAFFFEGLFAI